MAGLQRVMIHAIDDGGVHVLAAWRRDDDFFGAGREVRAGLFFGGEKPGAFQHHVDGQVFPWQVGRIAHGADLDLVAVDDHEIAVHRNLGVEFAVGGIVARQMGVGFRVAEIVDGNDLDFTGAPRFVQGAQNIAADAAVTVDGDADRHDDSSKGGHSKAAILQPRSLMTPNLRPDEHPARSGRPQGLEPEPTD